MTNMEKNLRLEKKARIIMQKDSNLSCVVMAIMYVFFAYASPILFVLIVGLQGEEAPAIALIALALPFIMGIVNAIFLGTNRFYISRETMLKSAIIVKYSLIPLYIVGGVINAVFLLLTFSPVVVMLFIAPFVVMALSIYGYITMVGGSVFSLAYILRAKNEGVHGGFLSVVGMLCQFLFTVDVVSMAILTLKEKKNVGVTIAILVLILLAVVSILGWLTVKILGAMF